MFARNVLLKQSPFNKLLRLCNPLKFIYKVGTEFLSDIRISTTHYYVLDDFLRNINKTKHFHSKMYIHLHIINIYEYMGLVQYAIQNENNHKITRIYLN